MSHTFSKEELLLAYEPIKLKDFFIGNQTIPYLMFDHQDLFVTNSQDPENASINNFSTNNIDNNGIAENASSSYVIPEDHYPSDRQDIFYRFTIINGKARARNSGNSQKGLSNLKNISSATSSRNGSFMQTSMCSSNTPGGSKRNSNSSVQIKRSSKNYIQDIITECRRGSGTKRSESPALLIESLQKRNSRTIVSPFSQSPMMKSVQLNERGWFYVDEQDCIQGPFTSIEMDNWYMKGFFHPTLLVGFKSTNKKLFFQLETLYQPPKQHPYLNREVKEFLKNEKSNFKKRSSSFGVSSTLCRKKQGYACTYGYYGNSNVSGDSPNSLYFGKNIRKRVRHSSILNSTPKACLRMEEMINHLISKQSNGSFNGYGSIGDSKKTNQKRNSNNLVFTNSILQQKSSEVFTSENEQNEEYNINESQNEDNNSTNATPVGNKKRLSDSMTDDKEYFNRFNQQPKENKKVKDFQDKSIEPNQIEEDCKNENKEQKDQQKWRSDKYKKEDRKLTQRSQKPVMSNAQLLLSKRTETQELE